MNEMRKLMETVAPLYDSKQTDLATFTSLRKQAEQSGTFDDLVSAIRAGAELHQSGAPISHNDKQYVYRSVQEMAKELFGAKL